MCFLPFSCGVHNLCDNPSKTNKDPPPNCWMSKHARNGNRCEKLKSKELGKKDYTSLVHSPDSLYIEEQYAEFPLDCEAVAIGEPSI